MRSGRRWSTRAFAAAVVIVAVGCAVTVAGASSQAADTAIARAGVFVVGDFPGFASQPSSSITHADQVAMAKGIDGCSPYVTMQKRLQTVPLAASLQFTDDGGSFGNEVAVFPTDRAASALLGLAAKSSMVGCLENYLEKQFRQQRQAGVDDVSATLERQAISGLGDDSVVYEGSLDLTGADGKRSQVAMGSVLVRVGRATEAVVYFAEGSDPTGVLAPAIDASVARLRAAQMKGTS
jgi:hypothetical protein